MKTITGLFSTHHEARTAVAALEQAGIPSDDISLISPNGEYDDGEGAATGAGIGAAVGGVGGLLAGLGSFAVPGIGPVVGAGWLVATIVGAAAGGVAGGLIGTLVNAGVDESDAHVYAEGVKRGGTLVTARVEDSEIDAAQAILDDNRRIDTAARRREYEEAGWSGFNDEYVSDDEIADADRPRPVDPVVAPYPR